MAKKPKVDTHAEMAEELDRELLRVLKEGDTIVTEDGPVTVRPSAAKLNQIRARLRDLGVQSPLKSGTAAGNLVDEARIRFKGRAIPPVNTEDRDAATGTHDR